MRQIEHFVPGNPASGQDEEVLSRLRWPIPPAVIEAYVRAYTAAGEQVLLPYCQSAAEVREVGRLERQPVALHYDPLLVLLVQTALLPVAARDLDAAVTRLGDSPKQGVPLRQHLAAQYATTCPACLRPAISDYFIWEQGLPATKHLHCPECEWEGQAGVEHSDLEPLAEIPPRGLHYHYLLDRIAPQGEADSLRPRLEPLLELYTARNLSALVDLTRKIEANFPAGPLRGALWVMLLDCLDRCSALAPLPGSSGRRPSGGRLARPARFVERNVWLAFEEAAGRVKVWSSRLARHPDRTEGLAWHPDRTEGLARHPDSMEGLARLPEGAGPAGLQQAVNQGSVRDLPARIAAHSLPLVLVSPPPLDVTAWSLSYLWGAWLLGTEAVEPLRPLLRARTPDMSWYARVLSGSFRTLADLLAPAGHLLVVVHGQRPAIVEALLWAAARARLQATTLVHSGDDYRLELAPAWVAGSSPPGPNAIQQAAREAIVDTLRARGEPTPWPTLHAAIHQQLSETGLLGRAAQHSQAGMPDLETMAEQIKAAADSRSLVRLEPDDGGEELWWLARPGDVEPPLADRVEATAWALLQEENEQEEAAFIERLYARFPGSLTPDGEIIAACLHAYANEVAPGRWRLRSEDRLVAREAERQEIVGHLLAIGERMGYRARAWEPFDVAWFEGRRLHTAFLVRWQAALGDTISAAKIGALGSRGREAGLYLVIPGGRSALASFKLARNPLLQQGLERAGCGLIKYRHVRQLAAEPEVDEYALRAVVGLDPIVEREVMQIPLF